MKNKPQKDKAFEERFEKRRKRARKKDRLINLGLLRPPAILSCLLLLASVYSFWVSLLLIYFILPLFYTVEKRIRCLVSGIGNPKFSYADGYKAFFQGNRGGVFGIIFALICAFLVGGLFSVISYAIRTPLLDCFPAASMAYQAIKQARAEGDRQNLTRVVNQNRANLTQPFSIRIGLIFYVPIFIFFYSVDSALSNHYLAGVVLPDIDNNISAAQARNLSKGSFGSFTAAFRFKKYFSKNWVYFVIYTLIYGSTLYGVSNIQLTNSNLVALVARITPIVGLFTFLVLNVFILVNCYAVIEESQDRVLASIPATRKVSIYQTYCNPNYIHGEESAIRNCFIPSDQGTGSAEFYSPFTKTDRNPFTTSNGEKSSTQEQPKSERNKQETTDEQPSGVVFDFTKNKKENGDNK